MARADLIRFECPACGRHVRAPQESAGGWAECASCHEVISVPGAWPTATEETLSLQEIDTFRPSEPELPTLLPALAAAPRRRSRGVLLGLLLACATGLGTAAVVVYLTGPRPRPPEPEVAAAPAPAPAPAVPPAPPAPPAGDEPVPVAPAPRLVPTPAPVPT